MDCMEEPELVPAMPDTCIGCRDRGMRRALANLSVMNEADDPVSRIALASADEQSGDDTKILHVISRELGFNATAAFEVTCCSGALRGLGDPALEVFNFQWNKTLDAMRTLAFFEPVRGLTVACLVS